jgi:GT2 family glycosyltransferase
MSIVDLSVSIVLYKTDKNEVLEIIKLLKSSKLRIRIYLVDNSPNDSLREIANNTDVIYIYNNYNFGYGKAHNIAINLINGISKYHLILNSDVNFNPNILEIALQFMEENKNVALLSPRISYPNGELQYFCRLLPDPFDLLLRRFIPVFLKPLFKNKLNKYLLLHKDYSKQMNVPNLPGSFMFLRVSSLLRVGGFDENFFMYVEDVDLTRRLNEHYETLYYPNIAIVHKLARGSYTFSKLTFYHIRSAIYYFNKWGWFFDRKRILINKTLK